MNEGLRYHEGFGCNKLAILDENGFFAHWKAVQPTCYTCEDRHFIMNAHQMISCPKCSPTAKSHAAQIGGRS